MRGAEAILSERSLLGRRCVQKRRIAKGYRLKELDSRLRLERTRSEARLLHRAKLAGVSCPVVLEVEDFTITMGFIEGMRPEMHAEDCREAGRILAALHESGIIHGDFTPANLIMERSGKISVIDFGLGFMSNDIEDMAVDVFTMIRALGDAGAKDAFIDGYSSYAKAGAVLARVKQVEKRVRYAF